VGLFENPYLEPAISAEVVGNPEYMKAGYDAQLRTVVMLKNQEQILPLEKQLKVYIPQRYIPASRNWFGNQSQERWVDAFSKEIVMKYFEVVETPQEADFALVGINSPDGGTGYDGTELEQGGNGYIPISLQYGTYTAENARATSIAGGSPLEDFTNRTYKGKTTTAGNSPDMELVIETRKKMGEKPVIVVVNVSKPMVFAEIEPAANAILVHMGVQDQALMELITGAAEPSALLPFQMPAHMNTVEEQYEDVPRDMECYTDSDGHEYDFAFGLNWSGIIEDSRVAKYK
jgi:beta-glucosidase